METNKKNGSIVAIVILAILVVVLGGYIGYDKFLSNNNTSTTEENSKSETKEGNSKNESTEEKNIEYVFDENNIYNKDDSYNYKVVDKNDFAGYVKSTENGVIVNDNSNNISYEINKKYKTYIETTIFKGGPGMDNYKAIFLTEDGTIEYLKYDVFANDLKGNIQYGFRLYKVNNLKNVEKLYLVELTSDRPVSPNGQTVVAQTKDGILYDLYDYVYGDTNLIGSSK